jgi:hypothetical protein
MSSGVNWNNPEEIISAELEPHETLLWFGRPRQGLVVRASEFAYLILFLLVFGSVFVGMIGQALNNNGPQVPFFLIGLPHFVFMAAYLVGRPTVDSMSRARCAYGVTCERIIVVGGLFGRRVRSFELDAMTDARLVPAWRGTGGTIRFGCMASHADAVASQLRQRNWAAVFALDRFELDRDAQTVFRLISSRLQRKSARRRGGPAGVVTKPAAVESTASWESPNEVIEAKLAPGELLLWAGRPRQGFKLRWFQIVVTLLVFLWMQAFFMAGGRQANVGIYVLWFLLGVKAVSILAHVGRSMHDSWVRRRTAYGVTTNRVLILTGGLVSQMSTLALNEVAQMVMTERGETGGTILVGPDLPPPDNQKAALRFDGTPAGMLKFDLAEDALLFYRLVRRVRRPVEAVS